MSWPLGSGQLACVGMGMKAMEEMEAGEGRKRHR